MADERPWGRPVEKTLVAEPVGDDLYAAPLVGFGGVTLGFATLAAGRTCPQRSLHSLHAHFIRPVPSGRALLAVERVRDGRRFAQCRVQVRVEERLLCEVFASFAAPATGPEYQEANRAPDLSAPEDLPTEE